MTNWAHWGLCKIKLWWPNGQLQSNPRYLWPLRHVTRLGDDLAWLTKQLCLLIHVHEYLNFQIDSMIGIFYVFSWMHIYRLLNFKSYRFNGQAIYIGLTNSHRIRNKCFFFALRIWHTFFLLLSEGSNVSSQMTWFLDRWWHLNSQVSHFGRLQTHTF